MTLIKSTTRIAAAAVLGLSSFMPSLALAGDTSTVEANVGVSNLYLFRGLNLSGSNPQVFGGVDYSHQTGFYAGFWASNESVLGTEVDLYAGFRNEVEGFSYDLGVLAYEYPNGGLSGSTASNNDFGDFSEIYLNLSYMGFGVSLVDGLQGDASADPDSAGADYQYYSLSYDTDHFGILAGVNELDSPSQAKDPSHTHVDLNFYVTNELTITLSQIVDSENGNGGSNQKTADDLLFVVNWEKTFEIE